MLQCRAPTNIRGLAVLCSTKNGDTYASLSFYYVCVCVCVCHCVLIANRSWVPEQIEPHFRAKMHASRDISFY